MAKIEGQKAIEYLQVKWVGRPCPMCGVSNWSVHDSTFQLTEFNQGSIVIGGPVIPIIPVSCTNCGNTILVNAIIAGFIKPEIGGKP